VQIFGTKRAPTRAILIAQYRVCAFVIDGVEAVLKVCTMTEETISEFEIYCANRLASILIALFRANIMFLAS
jgi:hypothetical protein